MSRDPVRATLRPGGTKPGNRRPGRSSRIVFEPGRVVATGLRGRGDAELTDAHAVVVNPVQAPVGRGQELVGTLGLRSGDRIVVWAVADWIPVWGDKETPAELADVLARRIGVSVSRKPWNGPVTWWEPVARPGWFGPLTVRTAVLVPGLLLVAWVLAGAAASSRRIPDLLVTLAAAACLVMAVVVLGQWLLGVARGGRVALPAPLRPAPAIPVSRHFLRWALLSLDADEVVLRAGNYDEVLFGGPRDDLGVAVIQAGRARRGGDVVDGVQLRDRHGTILATLDRQLWFGTPGAWQALVDRARTVGIDVRPDVADELPSFTHTGSDFPDRTRMWLHDAGLAGPVLVQAAGVCGVVAAAAAGSRSWPALGLAGAAVLLLAGPALVRIAYDRCWRGRLVTPEFRP